MFDDNINLTCTTCKVCKDTIETFVKATKVYLKEYFKALENETLSYES